MYELIYHYTTLWRPTLKNSQAHHVTSILSSIQVTPVESTIHIPVPPPKTGPPFAVLGLANKGFLAKVKLSFSGLHPQAGLSLSEQTFIFEHWVDVRWFLLTLYEQELILP